MALIYKACGPTASGTAVARASIDTDFKVPNKAKELVGLYCLYMAEAPDPADSLIAVGDITGTDFNHEPCEWLFPVASGKLGAIDQLETTPMYSHEAFWEMNLPVNGGEELDVGIEPCSAVASNGQAGVQFIFSTQRSGKAPIYGKFSREIATGTTVNTQSDGTDIRISNGIKMKEMIAVAVTGTGVVVADEELLSKCTMKCSVWTPIQSQEFFIEPVHGIEATSGATKVGAIARLPLDAEFDVGYVQAVIETKLENLDAMTNAGVYVHGVRWFGKV